METETIWALLIGLAIGAFIGAGLALDGALTRDVSGNGNDFD
jgi:predicted NBD/HSP70 family sugar kinase